ncbi:MAG TPA: hypothetical protein P5254_16810 [Aquihabitans sp.]|nr:hypothetical protein [Aquihabitans sp.]
MAEEHPHHQQAPVEVQGGDAVLPDADEAPTAADLAPEEPPSDAPATGDPDKKPAVSPPVPAHGEVASYEQLAEGDRAVEAAGGGGTDTAGIPTGAADTGREGQGGTGQGTDDAAVGSPERTAEAMREARR